MDPTLQAVVRKAGAVYVAAEAVMKAIDDPGAGPAAAEMQKGQLSLPWHAGCRAALEHLRTHPDVERLRQSLQDLAAFAAEASRSIDAAPPRAEPHPWTRVHANGNGHAAAEATS